MNSDNTATPAPAPRSVNGNGTSRVHAAHSRFRGLELPDFDFPPADLPSGT